TSLAGRMNPSRRSPFPRTNPVPAMTSTSSRSVESLPVRATYLPPSAKHVRCAADTTLGCHPGTSLRETARSRRSREPSPGVRIARRDSEHEPPAKFRCDSRFAPGLCSYGLQLVYLHYFVAARVDHLHCHALVLAFREWQARRAGERLEAIGIDHA